MQQTNPMRMEKRRLADLIPAAYNPRKALTPADPEYQDIKASIQGLGYADPIVINYDGTIIKGHQRRTVMMDMGIEEAEVVVLDIRDKAKEKMINVALNKITGKWDLQILKDLLSDLDLNGYDFSVTGFQSMKKQELLAFIDQMLREYKDQTTVHFEPKPTRNDMHPTMKPVPLIGRLMNNSSRPGWMVGDFFAGSGSTLMAAEQLGRTAFCMELDEKNCDIIVKRWETYTGQKAEKL